MFRLLVFFLLLFVSSLLQCIYSLLVCVRCVRRIEYVRKKSLNLRSAFVMCYFCLVACDRGA